MTSPYLIHRISSHDLFTLLQQPWPFDELGGASVTLEPWIQKILVANQHTNRVISPTNQDRLQEAMREGEWMDETGEPILLSKEMRMSDGQNRLIAALETETTIRVVVIWGVPLERRRAINIGKKRSGADQLAIEEVQDATHLAAAARFMSRLTTGTVLSMRNVIRDNRLAAYLREHPRMRYSVSAARKISAFVPSSIGTPVHYLLSQKDDVLADTMFSQLGTGEHLSRRDPVHVLREVLIRRKQKDPRKKNQWNTVEQATIAAQLILTWNAVREKKALYAISLNWKSDEDFPEIL